MSVILDIQIADDISESIEEPPPSSQLLAWAQAAWQGESSAEPELSLRIVSAAESQQLNNDYRGKNSPTNVLSFSMEIDAELLHVLEGQDVAEDDNFSTSMLGDLAICAEVVEHEANQQNKTLEAHWAHMVVHGMLHLQGYDHIENDQAEEMEALETSIMQKIGFSDPYQFTADLIVPSITDIKS